MLTALRSNPYLRSEFQRITHSSGIKWSFVLWRVVPLTFLTLVGLIPTFFYIDDSRIKLLPIMAVILYMPRFILAVRSIFEGIYAVRQDITQQRWEVFILTGISAHKIAWSKWARIVAKTLPDQILFSLPALGLSLGISQFFQTSAYCPSPYWGPSIRLGLISTLLSPYCYNSNEAYWAGHLNPSVIVILIGAMIIVVTAFMETGLNASIGLMAGFSRLAGKGLGAIYGIVVRLGLTFIIYLSFTLIHAVFSTGINCKNLILPELTSCVNYDAPITISYDVIRSVRRVNDTFQLAYMSLFDHGTLLAANAMRPNDYRLLRIKVYMDYRKHTPPQIRYVYNSYDNRPLVLRNLIALFISGVFYGLLIRYFLHRAARFAIVNHGASGYLEL